MRADQTPVRMVTGRFVHFCFLKATDDNDFLLFYQPFRGMMQRPPFMGFLLSAHSFYLCTLKTVFQSDFLPARTLQVFPPRQCSFLPLNSTGIRPIFKSIQIVKKKVSAQSIFFLSSRFRMQNHGGLPYSSRVNSHAHQYSSGCASGGQDTHRVLIRGSTAVAKWLYSSIPVVLQG